MSMTTAHEMEWSRRALLSRGGIGFGAAALQGLFQQAAMGNEPSRPTVSQRGVPPGILGLPHFAPKAKRVIYLYMSGGPSHLETFDYKPELDRLDGKPMPESFTRGQPIAQLQGQALKVQGHLSKFRRHGQSGQWISDFLPWHGKMADDLCIIRSMVTDQINHDPAHTVMNTGSQISGRPSIGSWLTYGLGSECDNLPGFVVMTSFAGRNPQPISQRMWGPGFLPGRYQGVELQSGGVPVHYLRPPMGVSDPLQGELVRRIQSLDDIRNRELDQPEVRARIAAYEMAFRMQTSVPQLMNLADEPKSVLNMYGATPGDGSFASNCLLGRKLAEQGVRFIQLYHRDWDHHGDLALYMDICCKATDRATWALLTDLKQRGMLDETLVIWGGEFGRTPMFQGKGGPGRDHHMKGFSLWMAGGGIKPGTSIGATDELGYNASDNVVHVRDLHATLLHQMGIRHDQLSFRHQGLDMRLTGVEPARVLTEALS